MSKSKTVSAQDFVHDGFQPNTGTFVTFEKPCYAEEPRVQTRGDIEVGLGRALFTSALEELSDEELRLSDADCYYRHCLFQALDVVRPREYIEAVDNTMRKTPYLTGRFYPPIDPDSEELDPEFREGMPSQPLGVNPKLLGDVVRGLNVQLSTAIAAEGQMMRCFLTCRTNLERFVFFEIWLGVMLRFCPIERCFPLFDVHGMIVTYCSYVSEMTAHEPGEFPVDRASVVSGFWESLVFDLLWFRNKELPLEKFVIVQGKSLQTSKLSAFEIFNREYESRMKPVRAERCGFLTYYHLGKGGLLASALSFPDPAKVSSRGVMRFGRMHCYICYLGHVCAEMGGTSQTVDVADIKATEEMYIV